MGKRKNTRHAQSKQDPKGSLETALLDLLGNRRGDSLSAREIQHKLGAKKTTDKKAVQRLLDQFVNSGLIAKQDGSYILGVSGKKGKNFTGVLDHVSSRFGYVVIGEEHPDVFVRAKDLKTAVDGDTVSVSVLPGKHGEHPEGKVVEVLKRKRNQFVGKIEVSGSYAFVVPDFRKLHQDFFVAGDHMKNAHSGDKVIIEVISWGDGSRNPEGTVVEVLGKAGEHEAEIHSIIAEFGLPMRFPPSVIDSSEKIADDISKTEIQSRRDFRDITTFTIDPEDAKDFDDALSFRKLDNGNVEVGVHIADVTHYVQPDSALEKEAVNRGTSVYLVDRTIPMLPERLSNELCSLRPHEVKLTFSAVFELNADAKIEKEWFGRTVIHSDRRFSYEEAQKVLDTGHGDYADELKALNQLALKLRDKRFAAGAVNFETTEVKFQLDERGRPLAVIPKVRKDAHKLIEEFMLLANRQVARFVFFKNKGRDRNTFVYRVHDHPDEQKIHDFAVFAKKFGYRLDLNTQALSKSLNTLMHDIEGKPEQNVLEQVAIRAMAKAKYTTDPKGHFGLGFDHYTHFTSPIRRYPDMMVHRLLQHYLDNGKPVERKSYEDKCLTASELEKRAADAERASIKYKQVEYMTYAEDKMYEGLISGVTEWGIYAEIIETRCEGMIRMSDLDDDYYEYDEKNYRIVGRRRKKTFTLGDHIRVRVKKTDIDRRLIDLVLSDD